MVARLAPRLININRKSKPRARSLERLRRVFFTPTRSTFEFRNSEMFEIFYAGGMFGLRKVLNVIVVELAVCVAFFGSGVPAPRAYAYYDHVFFDNSIASDGYF